MHAVELRAWPAHAVATAGAWIAALIAADHLAEPIADAEGFVAVLAATALATLIRSSDLRLLARWAVRLGAAAAAIAVLALAYLSIRGPAPVYELVLPTLPVWAVIVASERRLARQG